MKIKALQRGLLGIPLGIAFGYVITIVISLFWVNGYYSPCVPALVDAVGSEIGAVVLQAVLCGLLGAGFAAASVIWEMENWSLVKQTGIHFLILAATMFPIAWFSYWMEHSLPGVLVYAAIFVTIFVAVWIAQYFIWKNKITALNKAMGQEQ